MISNSGIQSFNNVSLRVLSRFFAWRPSQNALNSMAIYQRNGGGA